LAASKRSSSSFFVGLLLVVAAGLAPASDKKGVGLSDLEGGERIAALNVAWYYTWKVDPIKGAPPEKFVPMIWGGKRLEQKASELRSKGRVPVLLALNEPDHKQAALSVEEVIHRWPELAALTDRISSPAPGGPRSKWFDRFMGEARQKNLKLDFIAMHLYGPPDVELFLQQLDGLYARYRMPVWITEFSVKDPTANQTGVNRYSEEEVLRFMQAVLPELEKRSYVERYAWFGAGKASQEHARQHSSRLFDENGNLTALGRFYARFQ
jgi:hypothetical protein